MKKMTPMILVILMLTSFLSAVDIYELQEESNNEETSARAGADPEVSYVTSPRETTFVDGEATNEILAGEPVNFKAYLRNSGDADLTNMQYTVTVFTTQNGERSDIATDTSGADLQWANDKAICANSCQNAVLVPGAYLDGGESTLVTTAGAEIVWTPSSGVYIIEVKVTSQVLGDPGNNEISFKVGVKDYHDIQVGITWLDSNGVATPGNVEGTDPVDFQVDLSMVGSTPNMNIRTTNMSIQITGGQVDGSTLIVETYGVTKTVTISDDGSGNQITDFRSIIGHDEDYSTLDLFSDSKTYTLTPPADGVYSVSVEIETYYVYDSASCATSESTCERLIAGTDSEDEYSGNNFDSITGSASTVHDITLQDFYLQVVEDNQGNEEEEDEDDMNAGNSDRYGFLGGSIDEPLSTGTFDLVAEVTHTSTSLTPLYDWNVTFTITDTETSQSVDIFADSCVDMFDYSHTYLGEQTERTDAEMSGFACAQYTFGQGSYIVEATLNMLGEYDESSMMLDDKISDMVSVNNDYSYDIDVVNFKPQILTVKTGDVDFIVGNTVSISATAFDVEGDKIEFTWADGSGNALNCDPVDAASLGECFFMLEESMVPALEVRVTASDDYDSDVQSLGIDVLTRDVFTASGLADGFAAVYTTTTRSSGLSVAFSDGPLDAVTTSACANSPVPVGSVTVTPSTTYDSSILVSHSITVHYPTELGVMYMWMEVGNSVLQIANGEGSEVDSTTQGYTYDFPVGSDMISPGTNFYLIAEECDTPEPPTGTITQLTATAAKGGDVTIAYNYDAMLSGENVRITVCMDTADCATPEVVYDRVDTDAKSITYASGTHAQVYDVSAQLCNQYSCGAAVSVSVTSDSEVAMVTATTVTIEESGENWVVRWTESSDDADVAGWYVCYNRGEFSASEMEILIDAGACTMVMDATEATIAKYTTAETTQVHFGIVPHDAVMNIAYGPSTDSILYDRAQDTTNPDDGSTTTDNEASSGVPTWTWGVIGAVVVVAFVVGAFILSRGESEDDDDKEWDY